MIDALMKQRSGRFLFAAGTPMSGFAMSVLLIHQNNIATVIALFSICLAALVGAGKFASP